MKKLLTVFAGILAAGGALVVSETVFAQIEPARQPDFAHIRTISVAGEAHQDVSPDQAILSMSLVSRDKDLQVAKSNNDILVERLVKVIKEFSIDKDKISTSGIYIAPEYNYVQNKQELNGYNVSRSIRVTIDDLTKQERLLSAIVGAKIDQVNGVEFQLADREKYAEKLRVKAFENAKAKATALAAASGSKLGQAITIATSDAVQMQPRPVPMMAANMADASVESVAPSLPGMINIQENIQVTFALE